MNILYLDLNYPALGLTSFDENELTDIFDIAKIYHRPVQQDLAGNLVCPRIIRSDFEFIEDDRLNIPESEKRKLIECPECEGIGYVTIEEFIYKHNYEETFQCKLCNGHQRIDITNKEEQYISNGDLEPLDIEYNDKKFQMNYGLAEVIFRLHGKPCKYTDTSIIISENS